MKPFLILLCVSLVFCSSLSAQLAPNFTIAATDGESHNLYTDYLDEDKTVVLKIMFVNCPPCNAIAPSLELLYQEWGSGAADVQFLSLSFLTIDSNADVLGYEVLHSLTFPGAGNDGGAVEALMPYTSGTFGSFIGTPTFVVIAPDKTVQWNPSGSGLAATLDSLDVAIAASGAIKPGTTPLYSLGGNIQTADGENVNNVTINYNNNGENLNQATSVNGTFLFESILAGSNPSITPSKNTDADNGVNLLDVFLIQKHILSIDTLDSPYKIIAADANANNTVNLLDVFLLQKLILNIDTAFSNSNSWRFVQADHVFPNPIDPQMSPAIESIQYNSISEDQLAADFIAIKVGDVNENANPSNLQMEADTRAGADLILTMEDQLLETGQTYELAFKAPNLHQFYGFQFSLQFDATATEFETILFSDRSTELGITANSFGYNQVNNGILTALWTTTQNISSAPESTIFTIKVNVLEEIESDQAFFLSSIVTEAIAIHHDGTKSEIDLQFVDFTSTHHPALDEYTLAPNPTENQIWLNRPSHPQVQEMHIYDSAGQLVKTQTLPHSGVSTSLPIDLKGFSNGLYFLAIRQDQQMIFQTKFVVGKY